MLALGEHQHDALAELGGPGLEAEEQLGVVGAGELGQHQAVRLVVAHGQAAGGARGHVVELLDGVEDLAARVRSETAVEPLQHPRDGGDGDAGELGDGVDRRSRLRPARLPSGPPSSLKALTSPKCAHTSGASDKTQLRTNLADRLFGTRVNAVLSRELACVHREFVVGEEAQGRQLEAKRQTGRRTVQVEAHDLTQPLHPVAQGVGVDVQLGRGPSRLSGVVQPRREGAQVRGAAGVVVCPQHLQGAAAGRRSQGLCGPAHARLRPDVIEGRDWGGRPDRRR